MLKKLIYWLLGLIRFRPDIVVLCYHSISSDWLFGTPLQNFKKQILYLKSIYNFYTLTDLYKYVRGEITLTAPGIVITFDDGYSDILDAAKFLDTQGIKAGVFVVSDPEIVDRKELDTNKPLLSTSEILYLYKLGWEIGCHSSTHTDFKHLTSSSIKFEISDAKHKLEKTLGINIRTFAYPKGKYSPSVLHAVKNAGFDLALTMDDGEISRLSNPYVLPRVGVNATHSFMEFKSLPLSSSILFRRLIKPILGL